MCIKINSTDNELETVKSLMSMSLNAIIADVFHIELDEIEMSQDLKNDLHMDTDIELALKDMVAEYFDGYQVIIGSNYTIQNLHDDVVLSNLSNICQ